MKGYSNKTTSYGLRFVLVASLILFLLATATEVDRLPPAYNPLPPSTQASIADHLIIPGTRLGPLTLGLSTKSLEATLGQASLRPQRDGVVYLYPQIGLLAYTEQGRVISATVRSPLFKTRTGIGVGSDIGDALRTLPGHYEMEGSGANYKLHCWSEGWHLEVKDNHIASIQITLKLITDER